MNEGLSYINDLVKKEIEDINAQWERKVFKLNMLNIFGIIYNLILLKGKKEAYKRIRDAIDKLYRQEAQNAKE